MADGASIADIHRAKFPISREMKIATAGSCFAQRLLQHLHARGFNTMELEPPPPGLTSDEAARYGFGLFSARYGNIYTARQLRLLAEETFGLFTPGDPVWEKDGRYYDALRPTIEPDGLRSADAVREQRRYHLRRVRDLIKTADVFVYTLGLTEVWTHAGTGTAYPTAPGVVCGAYDPAEYEFKNLTAQETYDDLGRFFAIAKKHNPGMKLLLTVSPQRPVATASGKHILAAAGYSKAALRAAAGQLESERDDVDYFPSYEIVTNPLAANRYFNPNLRTVSDEGAALVMDMFVAAYCGDREGVASAGAEEIAAAETATDAASATEDTMCDEELLEAFAP